LPEDGAHLFESHGDGVSLDVVRVGDQGKMAGIDPDPVRLIGPRRRKWGTAEREHDGKKNET
jgi:hypothetical protein